MLEQRIGDLVPLRAKRCHGTLQIIVFHNMIAATAKFRPLAR